MSYGYCPYCAAKGVNCARNPIGPTICENGHEYPHALRQPTPTILFKKAVKPLRIYVDMDGVIADFEEHLLGRNPKVIKLLPGTYISLKPIIGAIEAVRMLIEAGHDVYLATKIPTHNVLAATEKLHWINQYFPEMIAKTIITPDKGCLRGDILIDDRKHKANCENFEGTFIHFGTEEFPSWDVVLKFIEEMLC